MMNIGTAQSMHVRFNGAEFHKGPMTKSIQEQCGINMTFPGKTEYMDRYAKMLYTFLAFSGVSPIKGSFISLIY